MSASSQPCKHVGVCGGCLCQDVPYATQLQRKSAFLQELFGEFWTEPLHIIPSPAVFHYRNKIDPSFGLKRYETPPPKEFMRETVLGFKERNRWRWTVPIQECLIGPEGTSELFAAVIDWVRKSGLSAYTARKNTGFLRHLLIRDGKRSGSRMVVLITSPGELPLPNIWIDVVRASFQANSIYHGEFSGKADVATAERLTLLYGDAWINEILHISPFDAKEMNIPTVRTPKEFIRQDQRNHIPLSFRISPLSFFQTNPLGAERLYGLVVSWALRIRPKRMYDLYGGGGGIALACASYVEEIISVEEVSAATHDGHYNALENGVSNVTFVNSSVSDFLQQEIQNTKHSKMDAAVVDPPRAGMTPKSIQYLLALLPKHILYISCNPKRLVQELPEFLSRYRISHVDAIDLFPHTPHVEMVVSMELQ